MEKNDFFYTICTNMNTTLFAAITTISIIIDRVGELSAIFISYFGNLVDTYVSDIYCLTLMIACIVLAINISHKVASIVVSRSLCNICNMDRVRLRNKIFVIIYLTMVYVSTFKVYYVEKATSFTILVICSLLWFVTIIDIVFTLAG